MDATGTILSSIPLFRHFLDEEIESLRGIGRVASIRAGQQFDIKKVNSLNVVLLGAFEIESMGNTDVVYLAPGSFFGAVPFTETRQSGKVRALVDSTVMMFGSEDMYRFFLMSYKCLRGYLKILARTGFSVSEIGRDYFGGATRIVTVYGPSPLSGKSYLASLMGAALRKSGKTLLLDLSFSGESLFNFFEKKIAAPISHRTEDGPALERMIAERIERVDESLDCLNVAYGSKVRVNPDIISPLLFILSREYRHIVIDCGDADPDLRNRAFELSDRIFTVVKSRKEPRLAFHTFDGQLREGQRVYYVLNERFAGGMAGFEGGMVLGDHGDSPPGGARERVMRFAESEEVSRLAGLVTASRSALVLETGLLSSLCYGGLLSALGESGRRFDCYYGSAYGYIVMALSLRSGNSGEFRKLLGRFFMEDRMEKLLDVTFPTEHVYRNNLVLKLAGELFGESRVETFHDLPLAMLGRGGGGGRRIFSTGYLRDLAAASFCLYPVFEEIGISGEACHSGYPGSRVRVEDMLRIDVDTIVYAAVENTAVLRRRGDAMAGFFSRYLDFLESVPRCEGTADLADERLIMEVSEKEFRFEGILERSGDIAGKLLGKPKRRERP